MEIIFEFIFTILLEGCFEIISNKKINIFIRSIILAIVTLIYGGLILLFTILIIKAKSIAIKILFVLGIILILIAVIKLWVKVYKNKVIKKRL